MRKRGNIRLVFMAIAIALFLSGISMAGNLEPSGPPAPTMKTLDQIPPTWSQKLQCDTTACPRFEIVMDGAAVLDKETGLVWEKSTESAWRTPPLWDVAIELCSDLVLGGRKGWRLPTVEELTSLVDPTQDFPALSNGHPFVNVYEGSYWSATTNAHDTSSASCVFMGGNGNVGSCVKDGPFSRGLWCVRGGQGVDGQ